ncbi:MAG: heparan-alpha-glucosaminide N-acetyltransferase domain-containing protein [Capnocytophaga sp.]|nr:heparan-alpha-glucosaminide N-acetyltransferase domain-containing protein [Capnocytophaga sp.]
MKSPSQRLIFIDIIRAFAICMMLQGHFIDGLLANSFRDENNIFFAIWLYFRGITAPVFFTISGFIFMFLLIKEQDPNKIGWKHIRVQKGIRRGIMLIITGYLLRMNILNLFSDFTDWNVRMVDVLHCIGLSLLFLIAIYLFSYQKNKIIMPSILLGSTLLLFTLEPIYNQLKHSYLPVAIANYFTKANGSVFTIFPWFGYASLGAFMGYLFNYYRSYKNVYIVSIILCLFFGVIFLLSPIWINYLYKITNSEILYNIATKDYLFKRVGNVLFVFAFFILLRNIITSKTIQTIGQNTFSIYIIHYIILYGSFTGLGLYRFFHHKLTPIFAIPGAICFVISTLFLSFLYNKNKPIIEEYKAIILQWIKIFVLEIYHCIILIISKVKYFFLLIFNRQ